MTQHIRARWKSFAIFTILCGPIVILWGLVALTNPAGWPGLCISVGLLVGFWLWFWGLEIIIEDDRIIYRTLFCRKEVAYAAITKVQISIGANQKGYYRLHIYDRGRFAQEPLAINIKPFEPRDLSAALNTLAARAPAAEFDGKSLQLKDGKIGPIIREGVSKLWPVLLFILLAVCIAVFLRLVVTYPSSSCPLR
ncbi:MAG TPA: hypothetical protein VMD52_04810 [Patescibacteria group bacterium]|nr:hypothetical protein [Patescibacteria group bacterium]